MAPPTAGEKVPCPADAEVVSFEKKKKLFPYGMVNSGNISPIFDEAKLVSLFFIQKVKINAFNKTKIKFTNENQ